MLGPSLASGGQSAIANDLKLLDSAIRRAQASLLSLQHPEGFWLGELEANSTLCCEYTRYYTRFYLALLGQVSWKDLPAIPVELVLAPRWLPINLYSVSAWTRAMLVPLAIIHHFKPTRYIPLDRGISELFTMPDHRMASPRDEWFSGVTKLLGWLQGCGTLPSREAALAAAAQWILARTGEGCSGLGALCRRRLSLECRHKRP
jgi:squalene cyclase